MANLSQIEIFLEVVKHGSFIKAAHALGLTGPAISKQVQALEKKLGVRLLNRTTRVINLTEEGLRYSEKAAKALSDLREAEQEILESKSCPSGPLKISIPVSFGRQYLLKPISEYIKRYPDVQLEILFNDRHVDLVTENFDLAIRIGVLADSRLIARKIHHCPIILCASPELITRYGNPTSPAELNKYPAIIYNEHSNEDAWRYICADGGYKRVDLKRRTVTNTSEMMVQACLEGIGIAALPIFSCSSYLQTGKLIEILPKYKSYPQSDLYLIYKHGGFVSTRLRLFIEHLVEFAKHLPW